MGGGGGRARGQGPGLGPKKAAGPGPGPVHAQDCCACTRVLCMHKNHVHAQESCAYTISFLHNSQSIINQSSSIIINHHQSLLIIINHHQSSSIIINQHQSSSIVINQYVFQLFVLGAQGPWGPWAHSLTVSQTLKGSSRLKGFHTLGWRAFAAGGCAGAERVRRILAFPDRIARTHVPRS